MEPNYHLITDRGDDPLPVSLRRQGLRGRLVKACLAALSKFPHPSIKTPTNYLWCEGSQTSLFVWVYKGKTEFFFGSGDERREYSIEEDLRDGIPEKYLRKLVEVFVDCCEIKEEGSG